VIDMYAEPRQAIERHRDLLERASRQHDASRLRALRKASKRAERAERRLVEAQSAVLKRRSELVGGL
jgi:hypothetical protein